MPPRSVGTIVGVLLLISACTGGAPRAGAAAALEETAPPRPAATEAGQDVAPDAGTDSVARVPGLYIVQESNGLPGQDLEQVSKQEILVTRDRLYLLDHGTRIRYLFRLDSDPPAFWEIAPDEKEFRNGVHLSSTQRDRDLAEKQFLEHGRELAKDDAEFAAEMKAMHLLPGGRREVTVAVEEVAEPLLGHSVKRYVVKENGRVIVDARVSDAVDAAIPFFEFYRRVGAFSEEVLAKLKEIRGTPLEATITVVTATLNYDIHATVKEVVKKELPAHVFELPPGAVEFKETTRAVCPSCGVEVEKRSPPGKKGKDANGEWVYFSSKECARKWHEQRARELKEAERRAKSGGAAPGGG